MPALQSLVLTDRQTTPVNFTLTPLSEVDGVATVGAADASGVAISQKRVSLSRRASGGRIRNTMKFRFPTMVTEIINGVSNPSVAREAYIDVTFNFSDLHTEAERNDIVGMFASAFATTKALVHDTLVKDQNIW